MSQKIPLDVKLQKQQRDLIEALMHWDIDTVRKATVAFTAEMRHKDGKHQAYAKRELFGAMASPSLSKEEKSYLCEFMTEFNHPDKGCKGVLPPYTVRPVRTKEV